MENIKAVATVSENTKQEAIDQVKQQWQEEVASLQAIMKGNKILIIFMLKSCSLEFLLQNDVKIILFTHSQKTID
uniref:Rabaptin coiled-coil domain-containing protein n=1 Tax=Cyprinus carpio TaxID=7962 RepID=A0A8C2H113_CYPCA